jgi:hypothetical protein
MRNKIITRKASGGEGAILIMTRRQDEGGTDMNFSCLDHHFTISLQHLHPAYLHCHPNCLVTTHIFWRIEFSFCKMTVPYPSYRLVEEVYIKCKRGWGRHFYYALTPKGGRDWYELQSSKCTTTLSTCSNYARHSSTAILIYWYQLISFHALFSHSVKWQCLIRVIR